MTSNRLFVPGKPSYVAELKKNSTNDSVPKVLKSNVKKLFTVIANAENN